MPTEYIKENCEYVQDKDKSALFVNSHVEPDESVPLDHYSYGYSSYKAEVKDLNFSRLHRDCYTFVDTESGMGLKHYIYVWYPFEVKANCKIALKQMIDSLKSVEEFAKVTQNG